MKYFVVVLLTLAVNVKISEAKCEAFVTVNQEFSTEICAKVEHSEIIKLPHPENKETYIKCFGGAMTNKFSCSPKCFDIQTKQCAELNSNPDCVDSTEICAEGDTRVPYAPKTDRFQTKFFADCQSPSGLIEVGICFSFEEDCIFNPDTKKCDPLGQI